MGSRGKKSFAELSVVRESDGVKTVEDISFLDLPAPPPELTADQAEEWESIVDRLPIDWFPRETWGMLSQYCRHVVAAKRVAQLIEAAEKADEIDIEQYDRLLKMQEREGRAISSLATRMRITQQSTYHPETKKGTKGKAKRPWNDD